MAFNAKRNDSHKAEQGVWREILGGQFLIARAGNDNYLLAQERNGKRTAETAVERQRILYQSIAEGILLDWKDVEDAGKKPIPYSVDAAVEVLTDNPDLVSRILSEANNLENYRRDDIKGQAKKQPPHSSGD